MKIASIVAATLIVGGLAAGTTASAADGTDRLTKTVAFGDLNIDTSVGAKVLYARIRSAASEVCTRFEGEELLQKVRWHSSVFESDVHLTNLCETSSETSYKN
jgi:UrcA family protein